MTTEMLELARANAAQAGVANVEFRHGTIEDVPLPDAAVDVVISNCVINLSVDKPKVIAEMFRVLAPGGRIGISDVVAEDHLTPAQRAERGSYVGCIAGALSRGEYLSNLAAVGFVGASVRYTGDVADGIHNAIIQAVKPGAGGTTTAAEDHAGAAGAPEVSPDDQVVGDAASTVTCCSSDTAATCCEPSATSSCCGEFGDGLPGSCGCR
jgi:SAM-dependent methyltransferase